MPKIKYENKSIGADRLALIDQANTIISDYQAQGLTLTLRQLYYRLVASDLLPNTARDYKRLGDTIVSGRMAGLIDWLAIEDRGRNLASLPWWSSPANIIRSAAAGYRAHLWRSQPWYVEVWVEKQALESVIGRAADQWRVPYLACKGYMSASEMWTAAGRFIDATDRGKNCAIIHLGDHDPSGLDMTRDIANRLATFDAEVDVQRIALNRDQVDQYAPPPNPAKVSDSRAADYIDQHGPHSWELDALDPTTLHDLIGQAIAARMDLDAWEVVKAEERRERDLLNLASEDWDTIANRLGRRLDGGA